MNKRMQIFIHVAAWLVIFLSPMMFMNHGRGITFQQFLVASAVPFTFMLVFYVDYLWLAPRQFIAGRHSYFFLANIVMVVGLGIALHFWMMHNHGGPHDHRPAFPSSMMTLALVARNIFNLVIAAGVATLLRMALQWQKAEQARKEAELSNLRSQINPHFLLNTLNNIYALVAFDAPKAQEAIVDLSKMLRHILYDYQQPMVCLQDEVEFLDNYVRLMRIRLPQSVEVSTHFDMKNPQQKVAPMIFISLVENAFKHGVSPTEPCRISISLRADEQAIVCDIRNSNHPKASSDRSGHGIGLDLVRRRLDMTYEHHYEWIHGPVNNNKDYQSTITIQL